MALSGTSRFAELSVSGSVRYGDTWAPRRAGYFIDGTNGSPSLRVEFELRDGRVVCTGLHVEAADGGRGIRTGDLASLPALDRLGVEAFAELAVTVSDASEGLPDWWEKPQTLAAHRRHEVRTRGDADLKEAARVYRENIGGAPREAVAHALDLTPRTASRRIEAARAKGYLPATTRGKRKA